MLFNISSLLELNFDKESRSFGSRANKSDNLSLRFVIVNYSCISDDISMVENSDIRIIRGINKWPYKQEDSIIKAKAIPDNFDH